ncbi:hypothetical protein AB0M07_42745, partial [Streptomyces sp. NPDC052015]
MELRYPPLRRRANVALCRFQTVHTDEKGAQACTTCKGEGRIVREQHTYKVRIPAGIEDGQDDMDPAVGLTVTAVLSPLGDGLLTAQHRV